MKKIFLFVVLASLAAGFTISAQTSNLPSSGTTPDSPFYFLKVWKEQIQMFFTFGEENKAKQFLHLADVRLAEYQKMLEKGKTEIAQKTLAKYEDQLNRAMEKIQTVQEKGKAVAEDVMNLIVERTARHQEVLSKVLGEVPEQAKKGIENAIENSKKAAEKILNKFDKSQSCVEKGGSVSTALCCQSTGDFPNLCLVGACGCSPENSHEVKVCNCGENECWNGKECISR